MPKVNELEAIRAIVDVAWNTIKALGKAVAAYQKRDELDWEAASCYSASDGCIIALDGLSRIDAAIEDRLTYTSAAAISETWDTNHPEDLAMATPLPEPLPPEPIAQGDDDNIAYRADGMAYIKPGRYASAMRYAKPKYIDQERLEKEEGYTMRDTENLDAMADRLEQAALDAMERAHRLRERNAAERETMRWAQRVWEQSQRGEDPQAS